MATLADLRTGDAATITHVRGRGAFRRRVMDMGFIPGREVLVVRSAPLQDPVEYLILGYHVSLRRSEAELVEVGSPSAGDGHFATVDGNRVQDEGYQAAESTRASGILADSPIEVSLVGNPNSGKTSLFNLASRSREHTGNYAGVTVESRVASVASGGRQFRLTDLPGAYSLSPCSPDEQFVTESLLKGTADAVINVVDAGNLERNLYLTTQLIDMDLPVVIALNMFDEFSRSGDRLDHRQLGRLLGIPVVPTVGITGSGMEELLATAAAVADGRDETARHIHIPYDAEIELGISRIQAVLRDFPDFGGRLSSRFAAIRLLEGDSRVLQLAGPETNPEILEIAAKEIARIEKLYGRDMEGLMADARYGFIAGALKETLHREKREDPLATPTQRIDRYLTHKWLGFPLFLLFLWVMFQTTFNLGKIPVEWIDHGIKALSGLLEASLPKGMIRDLFVDGVIGGVGGVVIFLPNILILFLFISLMEDTGYMARVAFIMDRLMHLIGLHGKSFIPLIMGFGCNVPAVMATRTIGNRSDRLMTMLIIPLMSCSARLPVYILIAGAVFAGNAANVIFGLYLVGIVLSILVAVILGKTLFRRKEAPFVMELPPYRPPRPKAIVRHMWTRSRIYLRKMGTVILMASLVIWALGYFPRTSTDKAAQLEGSAIGHIGRFIQPVMEPLGFDWRMSVSALSGIAAKEVVVSTIGVLYHDSGSGTTLQQSLSSATHQDGRLKGSSVFTMQSGLAFMLFVLIYVPCIAVISAVRRESGRWKWPLLMIAYMTLLAWLVGWLGYQAAGLL